MTSNAVTASICASASEAALLVASFMPYSLDLGRTHRCVTSTQDGPWFLLGTPRDEYSLLLSPHSANIDRAKVEQQCGGILAQTQPDFARGMTIFERSPYSLRARLRLSSCAGIAAGSVTG